MSDCYISGIGAIFSNDTLKPVTDSLLIDTIPDVSSPFIISDTVSWTKTSGIYNCTSVKNFITVGNFYNDYNTSFVCNIQNGAYYFLDDVSVVEVSNANAGNDTSICAGQTIPIGGPATFAADYTWYELADSINSSSIDSIHIPNPHISPTQTTTYVMQKQQCNVITRDTVTVTVNCVGIKQEEKKPEWVLYPNPAHENVFICFAGSAEGIMISDVIGKEVKRLPVVAGKTEIDVSGLNNGIYFVSILKSNKSLSTLKFIVQH